MRNAIAGVEELKCAGGDWGGELIWALNHQKPKRVRSITPISELTVFTAISDISDISDE